MKKKVIVAMSGGVDSSVTAALLKEQGYEVIGVTMQLYSGDKRLKEGKRVANKLKIPHYIFNFQEIFEKEVIYNFCKEYRKGRTPNPCIRCNKYVKFGVFLKKAKELGGDYIATGHYAKIEDGKEKKRWFIKRALDKRKDQSYLLYILNQKQLRQTLMPLGNLKKEEVRRKARSLGLPVADRKESQEICFILDNDYGKFIQRCFPQPIGPGPILNNKGKIIGKHKGIIFYTIGQRKGIGITSKGPLYVTAINGKSRAIYVGQREEVYTQELIANKVNFMLLRELKGPIKVKAKIRYLHQPSNAKVFPLAKNKVLVRFEEPQWAITPGQSVVFYDKDILIGGGTILTNCPTCPLR